VIDRARQLARATPNVEFLSPDAEALPFDDATFTVLLCTTSFHHHPNPEPAVGETARVLTPGGRVVLADMLSDRVTMRVRRRIQRSRVHCQRSSGLRLLLEPASKDPPNAAGSMASL
jgi:ubiquinone/menaquinone biosynthesis C-methylase UbiE